MKHSQFMQEAIRLSRIYMLKGDGGPFGAVIVKHGKIIGRGWNQVTSTCDPTAHAEMVAIRQACKRLKTFELAGATIYSSCEPCPMCLAALYWARIEKIYYANTRKDAASVDFDDDFLYREISKPMHKRSLLMKPLLRSQALPVFKIWSRMANKVRY